METAIQWNKPYWGTNASKLSQAPGWKQPLAGNNPWLETAPGWKQPLAGDNPWLKTAFSWKRPIFGNQAVSE